MFCLFTSSPVYLFTSSSTSLFTKNTLSELENLTLMKKSAHHFISLTCSKQRLSFPRRRGLGGQFYTFWLVQKRGCENKKRSPSLFGNVDVYPFKLSGCKLAPYLLKIIYWWIAPCTLACNVSLLIVLLMHQFKELIICMSLLCFPTLHVTQTVSLERSVE